MTGKLLLSIQVILGVSVAVAAPVTVYVAPQGRDSWSGRLPQANAARSDGPLASVEAALHRVRTLRQGRVEAPARIILRGGTYELAQTLRLGPTDSGLSLEAFGQEQPVLSGGQVLKGWRKGAGNLWTAPAPRERNGALQGFNQLFINGRRATLARTPNAVATGPHTPLGSTAGFFTVVRKAPPQRDPATGKETPRENTAFVYQPGSIKAWPDLSDVRVVLYHSWETSRTPLASVEEDTGIVNLAGRFTWRIGYFGTAQRYYVENAPDALDAPGEWYLDKAARVVKYLARPGEDLSRAQVVAPRLTRLVELRGEPQLGLWVEDVRFTGLSFQYEDWVMEPTGHSDGQAVVTAPAAIMADGIRRCAWERCEIAHVGNYALWLRDVCKDNLLRQCRIHDVGTGGVRIGVAYRPSTEALTSSGNVVDNCHLYDGNHVYAGGIGLWIGQAWGNRITRNEIHDFTYSGISIGWNWGDEDNRCHDNLVEGNHVHHVMSHTLNDGGCIYTLGNSPGSIIRGNVFHDSWPWSAMGWGIYLDATTNRYLVENNLVYHTLWGGWMGANGNHENVIQNNIFALSAEYALWPFFEKRPNTFRRNIVYTTQGLLLWPHIERTLKERQAAGEALGEWDYNCYWDTRLTQQPAAGADPFTLRFFDREWEEWRQETGLDAHSVLTDPKFRQISRLDFTLAPDSPALKLGFRPLDLKPVGLYGDPKWVAEAKALKYPATVMPAAPAPPTSLTVADGFEDTAVGGAPDRAHVSGEEQGASIAVTDQTAATGRHSLKITDAPGLSHDWQPHFFYQPWLTKGTVRQRFDLRLEPGALLYTEWRDSGAYPANIGPSVIFRAVDGQVRVEVGDKPVAVLPLSQWLHVELEGPVGKTAARTWSLRLQAPGQEPLVRRDLPHAGDRFAQLQWLGFVSTATDKSVWYLDNLHIQLVEPEKAP